ncbi:MAG: hydratase [Panacagrimonas sp.]
MTERGCRDCRRDSNTFQIGPSQLAWDGQALRFQIDEVTVPLPSHLRGEVRVIPETLVEHASRLDSAGLHVWRPIAPKSRVEVRFDMPALRWSGSGYCDSNHGDEPLETSIRSWHWSRSNIQDGTAVIYDVNERSGPRKELALHFDRNGTVSSFEAPPRIALPASRWRVGRATRSQDGVACVARTLEDTPFYTRSLVSHRLLGEPSESVHESLDLDRFRSPVVQAMLPFRMPRRAR